MRAAALLSLQYRLDFVLQSVMALFWTAGMVAFPQYFSLPMQLFLIPVIGFFFAKALFGGGFMDKANWNDAVMHLQTAVRLAPDHIYHRLELAEVYVDLGKYSLARVQLQAIADSSVITH